ncbi:protein translocase subunit SecDF [Portibacter marinus]|uniref:protein translocase subunit SecDF n=1 Tax=Portibacter marinus TaxID=2898660 RepID=UPI0021D3F7DC|nr:protein translocase subunit SecDF [Portibacter marinus]
MQGKGLIKFFLILMIIVSAFQYLFVIPTNKIENQAEEYAERVASQYNDEVRQISAKKAARIQYLDSVSSEVVFKIPMIKEYTYDDLKKQQLGLGLDLKGGMSAVLQVDLNELLLTLSNNSNDPDFRRAMENANEALKSSQSDFITLFANEYQQIEGAKPLSRIFLRNESMREDINTESSNGEVVQVLRRLANETVQLTFDRLKERIDKLGVTQPNVFLDAGRDLIIVEIPGIENPQRARNFLQASAKLEFWDTYWISDPGVQAAFIQANERLKQLQGDTTTNEVQFDTSYTYQYDSVGNVVDSNLVTTEIADPLNVDNGPLFNIFNLNGGAGQQIAYGPSTMGTAERNKRDAVLSMLRQPEIKSIFPKDMEFRWSQDPAVDIDGNPTKEYELYAIKVRGNGNAPLEGDVVTNASQSPDPSTGEPTVSLQMNSKGRKIWADLTTKAAQNGNRQIAIVLDSTVVSAPRVNQPITGGSSSISGGFSVQEAVDLANILQIGKLPAKTRIIQESTVGPSLGKENIRKSLMSLVIGVLLILLFMVFYYGGGGIVSIIALLLNLVFIFGVLASINTVLTLPGMAGIVLTIGMAVDANVIIFERIREELRAGKTSLAAISDGFKNSYSAIIDANVTTILVALVLNFYGLGPIKGFAIVLIIGVISSVFTAVLVGKLIIDWWMGRNGKLSFWTPPSKNAFANLNVDWVGKRKIAYVVSGALIIAGLASLFTRGLDLGVDFKGGYSYNIQFEQGIDIDAQTLKTGLTDILESQPVVKSVDTDNTFNIVTQYQIDNTDDDAINQVTNTLGRGLNEIVGGRIDMEKFVEQDAVNTTHIISSSKVGPTIADDIKKSSFYAGIIALVLIFAYIFIRFNKWQFSLGAVTALFHDSLILLGVFSLLWGRLPFSLEIDQAFIAALLTVIGYSINDTVVVFDRIREYLGIYTGKSTDEVLNLAINSTFSRTIITSLTTLLIVTILLVFGGSAIKGFAFALFIGILIGTYSSIFVATPVVRDLTKDLSMKAKAKSEKKGFSKAAANAR